MERIRRSWELVKASWHVLRADRELLLYPVSSAVVTSLAVILVLLVWLGSGGPGRLDGDGLSLLDLVFLYVFYFIASSVVIFFNSALIAAANIRLDGGDPTLSDGFRIAVKHLPAILGWAAIAATVGLVLQALRERGGAVGAIVALIGNVAWSLITVLVVPILVVEGIGPIEAIKRSASLLRKTWGEQVVGSFSIGLITGLAFLGVLVGGGLLVVVLFGIAWPLGVVAVVFLIAALILLWLIGAALSGIFNVALYRYAVGKPTDAFFSEETLAGAFRAK